MERVSSFRDNRRKHMESRRGSVGRLTFPQEPEMLGEHDPELWAFEGRLL